MVARAISNPRSLQWWEWGKLAGAISVALLLALMASGVSVPPLCVALCLHLACDFTLQSGETAMHKGERGKHLVAHALANGLPLAAAGLFVGPSAVLAGAFVGVLSHYAVDWTRKFNLPHPWGALADQMAHVAVLVSFYL